MMNICNKILGLLIDKYERSRTGKNISLKTEKIFPEYADDADYDIFSDVNNAVGFLESKGFVSAKRNRNNTVDRIILEMNRLDDIYEFLSRKKKSSLNAEISELLERYSVCNDVLEKFCMIQIERIAENKNPEYFSGDIKEYELILKAVSEIYKIETETYIRDFSAKTFGDSKIFENIKNKVCSLLYDYGDFSGKETVLEELNIIKNPGHIYFKGCGIITLDKKQINLENLRGDIAISSSLLNDIDINITGRKVMTIENLTTFNRFSEPDTFIIYLGGFHNTHRRNFIKKLHENNKDKEYYHYGDTDAGGFFILLHLRKKTGINFLPYNMNKETLLKYSEYTRPLTPNDRKRLETLIDTEFHDVIEYMLKNNCKLEQEASD